MAYTTRGTLGLFPHSGVVVHMSLCAMLEIVYRSGTAYAPVDRPKMVTLKWDVASDHEVSQLEGS